MILFPRLTDENVDDQLNDIVRYYQKNRPEKHIGCWSLDPPEPKASATNSWSAASRTDGTLAGCGST